MSRKTSNLLDLHPDAQGSSPTGVLRWFSTNPLLLATQLGFWHKLAALAFVDEVPASLQLFSRTALLWAGAVSFASLKYDFFRTKLFLKLQPALWFPAVLPAAAVLVARISPAALAAAKHVFASTTPQNLALIQVMRLVSVGLFFKAAKGAFPIPLALAAGVPDVVYGLSAIWISLFSTNLTAPFWFWWNVAGIAVVIAAGSGTAVVSLPGPFYKFRGKDSMLSVLQFPMVLAPSVVAPILICLQVGSILWTPV